MKVPSLQSCALGLLALMLVAFIHSVDAVEDPFEAQIRQHRGDYPWIRTRYFQSHAIIDSHLKPGRNVKLTEYPAPITNSANALRNWGTHMWKPEDNIVATLDNIEHETVALLVNPFHPKLVETQPKAIRDQHFRTISGVTEWLEQNYRTLVNSEGKIEADKRIIRFKRLRLLAQYSTMLPHA